MPDLISSFTAETYSSTSAGPENDSTTVCDVNKGPHPVRVPAHKAKQINTIANLFTVTNPGMPFISILIIDTAKRTVMLQGIAD